MMIDSDMFLIKNFCVTDYLKDWDIAGLSMIRGNTYYLCAYLIFFKMDNLPNKETMQFKPIANIAFSDTGGSMYYYFKANPFIKIRYFDQNYRLLISDTFSIYAGKTDSAEFTQGFYFVPKCKKCQSTNSTCQHGLNFLAEYGISQEIIDLIAKKDFIPNSELVMKGTFIHYQAVSNYIASSQSFLMQKNEQLNNFITTLLN